MELPPKAVHALIDIKQELLNAQADNCIPEEAQRNTRTPDAEESRVRTFKQRHARTTRCQQPRFWSQFR
jgi:hypothetical protein